MKDRLKTLSKGGLSTSLFNRSLRRLGVPIRCWGAVVFHYWVTGDGFFPRLDKERLIAEIRSGKLAKHPGFGPLRSQLLQEWLAQRDGKQADADCGSE